MKRHAFIVAAVAAAAGLPARAASGVDFTFPGQLGVYAEHLNDSDSFADFHGGQSFSSASVIKLLIAVGAMRKVAGDGIGLAYRLSIAPSEIVGASDTFATSRPGSLATIHDLMAAMITRSDNTAANVLLDWVGMLETNALADECGFSKTRFARHFMDFPAKAAGYDNVTSPRDMALLAKGIALGVSQGFAGVPAGLCRFIYNQMLHQEDRETIPSAISRPIAVANKTGELTDVRHDVAIVGLGRSDAYTVALLSQSWVHRATAIARLRQIAAAVDVAARS
jgi:beta-lactamase class A